MDEVLSVKINIPPLLYKLHQTTRHIMIKLVFQKRKIGMNKTHLADGLCCELAALVLTELQIYQNF